MESRTKNATRNIIFGIFLKAYQIIIPFIMRTAMIYFLGVQYLGLNGLFTSILQVLNLTELGVGSAMVFSMYKPIANRDKVTLCALLKLYKVYYSIIGCIIAIIGILLTPFVPKLINGEVPDNINLYVLYLLNLSATVLSYWLFAYKNSLLQASQRTDIVSKVTIITSTFQYAAQLLVLVIFHNYYIYVIIALFGQIMTNIITAIISTKLFPDYQPYGNLDKVERNLINNKIKDLFTAKLGTVVIGPVDTIVISYYLGLLPLAIYQNYYFIVNSIYSIIVVLFSSVMASIGNSLVTESIEKNYDDFLKFTFLSCFLITVCVCCFSVLLQPFIKVWFGQELMLNNKYLLFFCVYFFVMVLGMVWATIKDAAGLWHQDRFRPLIGAFCNLFLNILLVKTIGLYGVILSTIISYIFISMPWLIHNLFKYLFQRSMKDYIEKLGLYIIVCIICCSLTMGICTHIQTNDLFSLIIYGIVAVITSCIIQIIIYRKRPEYKESKILVKKMLNFREK